MEWRITACTIRGCRGWTETRNPRAVREASPQALHHFTQADQLCIVHQVRNALSYVSYKDRKAVAADLKKIYKSAPLEEAEQQLDLPRSDLERTLPDDPPLLGPALGAADRIFRLSAGNPQGDLHDQRHRVAEPLDAPSRPLR